MQQSLRAALQFMNRITSYVRNTWNDLFLKWEVTDYSTWEHLE